MEYHRYSPFLASDHIEKLLDRRQTTTSFYLTINTGVAAAIGLILSGESFLSEVAVWLTILMLLAVGLFSTWIWRSLLNQYEVLIGWWYARLREMETSLPEQEGLITREYDDLYGGGQPGKARLISMTGRERTLSTIFMALYIVFALGVVWTLLR